MLTLITKGVKQTVYRHMRVTLRQLSEVVTSMREAAVRRSQGSKVALAGRAASRLAVCLDRHAN